MLYETSSVIDTSKFCCIQIPCYRTRYCNKQTCLDKHQKSAFCKSINVQLASRSVNNSLNKTNLVTEESLIIAGRYKQLYKLDYWLIDLS
jgi:hypothetical protein